MKNDSEILYRFEYQIGFGIISMETSGIFFRKNSNFL